MENSIDFSDNESKRPKSRPKMTLMEFDRQILKAISETSMQSLSNSIDLQMFLNSSNSNRNSLVVKSTPNLPLLEDKTEVNTGYKPRRNYRQRASNRSRDNSVTSTPNLATYVEPKVEVLPRKSSLINRRSTSTSGVSDVEGVNEITTRNVQKSELGYSKSFSGREKQTESDLIESKSISSSISSKGVHFCPVVAEVNWKDEPASTEHETSSSSTISEIATKPSSISTPSLPPPREVAPPNFSSSSEREIAGCDLPNFLRMESEHSKIFRPEPRKPTRISASQPDLADSRAMQARRESEIDDYSFSPLRPKQSVSQTSIDDKLKQRGSRLLKR